MPFHHSNMNIIKVKELLFLHQIKRYNIKTWYMSPNDRAKNLSSGILDFKKKWDNQGFLLISKD